MQLNNCKVMITGGAGGLGRSMVAAFLGRGAKVAVIDLSEEALDRLKGERSSVQTIHCDLTDFSKVKEKTDLYHDTYGAVDVLINNAGLLYSAPLIRIGQRVELHDPQAWRRVIDVNLTSVFNVSSCVAAKMVASRTKGVIVNISSVSASGNAGQSAYSAAKAGVNALTAVWAKELSPLGIRTVGLAPGYSETSSTREAMTESALKHMVNSVPLRRLGKPEEIAAGVLSVVENDFFNGKILELDGGLIV